MSTIVPQIDHQEEGVDLLLSQFNNSPNLQNLLRSWLVPLNELEQDLQDWACVNGITTAYGDFLDKIGSWMGVDRGILLDEQYRQVILAETQLEGADGTTEKLLQGLRVLCQTNFATFYELYPSTVYAHCGDGYNNATYDQIKRIVRAGCDMRLITDHYFDSMQLSEVIEQDNGLVNEDQEQYQVNIDGVLFDLITTTSAADVLDDSGDYFAELWDEEWTPMGEIIAEGASLIDGYLVDENGNRIVDENGNPFIYRDFTYA